MVWAKSFFFAILVIALYIHYASAHAAGPELSACSDLIPAGHGVPFQDTNGGYVILPSSQSLVPGSNITLTITNQATPFLPFKGHLLTAVLTPTIPYSTFTGSFTVTDTFYGQYLCPGNTHVTHTINAGGSANGINSIVYTYTVPPAGFGKIYFLATVVHYFTDIYHVNLTLPESIPVPPVSPNITLVDGSVSSNDSTKNSLTFQINSLANIVPPITKYTVDCADITSSTNPGPFISIYQGLSTTFTTLLPSASTLYVRINATNALGTSGYSYITIVTASSTSPLPKTPVNASINSANIQSIVISWLPAIDSSSALPILYYRLERQLITSSSSTTSAPFVTVYTGLATSFIDTTVALGSSYNYRLISHSLSGSSNPVSITYTAATITCPANCSGKGSCILPQGICLCNSGYVGNNCSLPLLKPLTCLGDGTQCIAVANPKDGYIYFRMTSTNIGRWFALGICTTDGMNGANIFKATANNKINTLKNDGTDVQVNNLHGVGFQEPNGGQYVFDNVLGFVTNTGTLADIQFRRPYKTSDNTDCVINPMNNDIVLGSWANGGLPFQQHDDNSKGRLSINFVTGEIIEYKDISYIQLYAPLIIGLIILALVGLLLKYGGIIFRRGFCNRKLLSFNPLPTAFDTLTLNFRQTFAEFSVAEFILVCIYIIALIIFIGLGTKMFSSQGKSQVYIMGHLTSWHLALAFLPASRNSFIGFIFGSSWERYIKFHRWCTRTAILCAWVHLFTMLTVFDNSKFTENKETAHGSSVVCGFIAFILMNVTALFAFEPIRRTMFELFYYTHLLIFPVILVFAAIHSTIFLITGIFTVIPYLIDRIIRAYRSRRPATLVDMKVLNEDPSRVATVLTIQIPKFTFSPGDYIFLNVPSLSLLEWHPFSIASAPQDEPGAPFQICASDQNMSSWTSKLAYTLASSGGSADKSKPVEIKVDGPHGYLPFRIEDYSVVVLLAGGAGITPLLSIASHIAREKDKNRLPKTIHVHLVWLARHTAAFNAWFPQAINELKVREDIDLHLYVTGLASSSNEDNNNAQVIPKPVSGSNSNNSNYLNNEDKDKDKQLIELQVKPVVSNNNNVDEMKALKLNKGRPDILNLFNEIRTRHLNTDSSSIFVHSCGPQSLVSEAQKCASNLGFGLGRETFYI